MSFGGKGPIRRTVGRRLGNLVEFHTHTRQKLLLPSHSERHYRRMGILVAGVKGVPDGELYSEYETLLMEALKLKTTPKNNINVLRYMMGYFKRQLTPDEKQELLQTIEQYMKGYVPLIVHITLINHYVRKYREPYLSKQTYLQPHPIELQLRNHV